MGKSMESHMFSKSLVRSLVGPVRVNVDASLE